jgi:hypothetical protein
MMTGRARASAYRACTFRAPLGIACAWVALVLFPAAALDPSAAQRTPHHDHVVVGGTPVERARVLAAHTRAMVGGPPTGRHVGHAVPAAGDANGAADQAAPRVLIVRGSAATGPTVFGTGGSALLASGWKSPPVMRPTVGTTVPTAVSRCLPFLPTPDPPPRAA